MATIDKTDLSTKYLLQTNRLKPRPSGCHRNIASVNAAWQKIKAEKDKAQLNSLPKKLRTVVPKDFNILQWSADETKILYQASQSATIPLIINPPLIGTDSTPQVSNIKKGEVYVYDIKEDRNYLILIRFATSQVEQRRIADYVVSGFKAFGLCS